MLIVEWDGNDLWNLLNLSNGELYKLYGQFYAGDNLTRRETIRRIANTKRNLLRQGKIAMPERSEPYRADKEPERISRRRARLGHNLAGKALETTVLTVPLEHLEHHQKLEEALEQGAVSKATFTSGTHEGYIKNADNEIEYTKPLEASRIRFQVEFDNEPKWPPVNRVESVRLPKKERKEADELRQSKRAVILPDLQIPYESSEAIDVALQVIQEVKPDQIILLGDMLDLSAWSKYIQRPEFATATQSAINTAHQLLATLRKMNPSADIIVLAGNHEERMEKHVLSNARAAYGLKRADSPEGWPVLSIPYLTAMDTLDIEYIAGYPANRYWINERLQVRHGDIARKGGTAKAVVEEEGVSTIFGHIHRAETIRRSRNTFKGGEKLIAHSPGCLCRVDGSVPSTKTGYGLDGQPIPTVMDWQQGFSVIEYIEGDSPFHIEQIDIATFDNHQALYRGKLYEPRT